MIQISSLEELEKDGLDLGAASVKDYNKIESVLEAEIPVYYDDDLKVWTRGFHIADLAHYPRDSR